MRAPTILSRALVLLLALAGCGGATTAAVESAPRAAALPERADVVVVGSGLTGLTAAYRLASAGVDVLVLDAAPRPGGRIQTVAWPDGLHGEAHMEEYWQRSPAYPLLTELGLPLDEDVAHSSVRLDGRIVAYDWPFGDDEEPSNEQIREAYLSGLFETAEERAALLEWMARVWAIYQQMEPTIEHQRPLPAELEPLTRTSFAEFVRSANLPPRVAEWIRVTVEPEMAIEWDQIAALDGIDEMRLFLDTPDGFGERNFHVRGGNVAFVRALLDRIPAGRVVTRARVLAVRHDQGGATVRVLLDDSRFAEVRADQVLLTMPVWDVGQVQLEPPLDEERLRALTTIRPASYVKVLIRASPEACPLTRVDVDGEPTEVLTLLSDSPAGSIYEASSEQRPCAGDDPGPRLFTLLLHARFARDVMHLPHDEIRQRVYAAMDELFPGISAHFIDASIFSYPRAVAYWPLADGRSRFDALALALRRPIESRLWIGGDTTENAHSEGAVQAGERMAREVLEARGVR